MLTLCLLRHAKSSWDIPGGDDFDRPLAPKGQKAAPMMGAYLAEHGLRPDLILCSAAARTRATLDLVMPFFEPAPPALAYEDTLYHATASQLLSRLRNISPRWSKVMLIGHNPGFYDLATAVTANIESPLAHTLAAKYPTAGLCVFTFETANWAKIAARTGQLTHFATPSALEKGLPTT